jgi:hypothetical protein
MFPLPRSIMQVDAGPTPTPTTKAASLQAQIQALTDLHGRLKTLRQIPSLVLKPPTSTSADGLPLSPHSQPSLRTEFEHMKEIGNVIRSDPIQDALRTARDSFQADTKDLNFNLRREHRKRRYVSEISAFFFSSACDMDVIFHRRSPSPGSPRPYVALERKSTSLFPVLEDGTEPLRAEGLEDYIRHFNAASKCKLHLWRKTRGTPLTDQPIILQFRIPDVLIAYISLVYDPTDSVLISESVTFFGPRERVSNRLVVSHSPFVHEDNRKRPTPSRIMQRIEVCHSRSQVYFMHTLGCRYKA